MKIFQVIIVLTSLAFGCTARDFFSYEENTGLYVLEKPPGYSNVRFGAELATTSTDSVDLLAVSAGPGTPTIFYKMAEDGQLLDFEELWASYMDDDDEASDAQDLETGASIVGLPFWGSDSVGCFAIGEPGGSRITFICQDDLNTPEIEGPPESGLGNKLAAVRPVDGDPWLLAAAANTAIKVYSDNTNPNENSSDTFYPVNQDEALLSPISTIAAGRDLERVLVATSAPSEEGGPLNVFLFVQNEPNSKSFVQAVCIERPGEPGFGGVLALGDLDSDGIDELFVSASDDVGREQAVYIYDTAALIPPLDSLSGPPPCTSPEPLSILAPEEGDLDIDCEGNCAFGTALAIGDIATDDDGPEIAVGAPKAKVEGHGEAGAVYVYRGELAFSGDTTLAGQVADSYPEGGHQFGGSVEMAPVAGRNELVVGAVGKGQVVVAFCTDVGEDLTVGADTTTDANGSVVSTRCRP